MKGNIYSCSETHWIYTAVKTQRNFTHIREGKGQKHLENRRFDPPPIMCVCANTCMHTYTVRFPTDSIQGQSLTEHVDNTLNSTTCKGKLRGHWKKRLSGFLSGHSHLLREVHSGFQKWQIHINTWLKDQNAPPPWVKQLLFQITSLKAKYSSFFSFS